MWAELGGTGPVRQSAEDGHSAPKSSPLGLGPGKEGHVHYNTSLDARRLCRIMSVMISKLIKN